MSKISIFVPPGALRRDVGYGTAAYALIHSLSRCGFRVPYSDPSSKTQLWFAQPTYMDFRGDQYNIAYTPWESTELPDGWVEKFAQADEVWATSKAVKRWYEENGVTVSKVLYHGIDEVWKVPQFRSPNGTLKFLHVGEPAQRKGGQVVFDAFRTAFANGEDVSLTLKSNGHSEVRMYDKGGSIIGTPTADPRVKLIGQSLPQEELVQLHLDHDVMVYPSWGEGFGFIPLNALATGMPTIVTDWWSDHYSHHMYTIGTKLVDSPWPTIHPGKMAEPNFEELVQMMRSMYNQFSVYADNALDEAHIVNWHFDWDTLVESAFSDFK